MTKSLQFLSGGGEMGALMRGYNWEISCMGPVNNWPQSLLTTLGILLNSKFPMFLFWGEQHICFYNDAYRPSLGNEGKHPTMLGMKGKDAWPEIWDIINPLIKQVLTDGEATWNEDQLIPIYRNGKVEDVYWTFSYSPVKDESGLPAGVFVTCTETTDKVNNLKKLAESNNQLNFAIESTQLGTWDFNPVTRKFTCNYRFKEWFDLPAGDEFKLSDGVSVVAENDRTRVAQAIKRAMEFDSGGLYDIEYSIINPNTKIERIVRANGRAWFGEDNIVYRFNGTMQDITEQAIARKNIENSEQRFRNLILQAPVLISTFISSNFIIETVNKSALEIWGKTYEQVINKPLFEVLPELEEGLKTILNNIYITGEPFIANEIPVQLKRTGKPGIVYLNSVYQPLRDLNDKICAIMFIGTEVTEAVHARKKIEESEQRFAAAIAAVQGILWTNNAKGEMEGEQAAWTALTGQSYEEYKGFGWSKRIHPDDAQPTIDAWNSAVNEQKIFVFEHRLKMKDGHWGLFSIKAIPILNSDGSMREWVGIHTDITKKRIAEKALKESEENFRGLVETLPHLVWITDEKGETIYASKSWQEYSGLNTTEGDKSWQRMVHPDDTKAMTLAWATSLATGKLYHAEARLKNKHAEYRWHLLEGMPLKNKDEKISKWIGAFTDIHDQKTAEEKIRISNVSLEKKVKERTEELQAANLALKNTNDELTSFTYIASHDLQEPLRKIQVFGNLIKETEKFSGKTQDYFNRIVAAGQRMQNLIVSLLDFSSTNVTDLNMVSCDLNIIVEESKSDLNLSILEKKGIIEYENLPTINGLRTQLSQLFTNLIDNALKYSRPEIIPLIKITVKHLHGNEIAHPAANNQLEYYAIKVADNGIGFENEYSTKIFELFQRLHGRKEFSGTGIGLAIVKKIVTNHNGFIIAEGKPNIGSIFTLFIPTS